MKAAKIIPHENVIIGILGSEQFHNKLTLGDLFKRNLTTFITTSAEVEERLHHRVYRRAIVNAKIPQWITNKLQ